jgi:phosphoserine phosphatase
MKNKLFKQNKRNDNISSICKILFVFFLLSSYSIFSFAQTYRRISGWSDEINNRIENFLNTTITMKIRKVAVLDGDGTVIGQVPYYLADEALYRYADMHYKGKKDSYSINKLAILKRMVKNGNNVSKAYVEDRVHFLSGMTPTEIMDMGYDCYLNSYQGKFYPEMKQLIANLKEYGFEIWILTASPEFLYQKFLTDELGVPDTHVLGVKAVVANGVLTDEIIMPIPQDDGKANVIPTFIKARPLIVAGNSRGDLDMLNQSCGLKIVVNPDNSTVRGKDDGPMNGYTVKQYWEKEGAVIVKCNDVTDSRIKFHTKDWNIRTNQSNPK